MGVLGVYTPVSHYWLSQKYLSPTSNFKVAMTGFFFSFLDLEARNFISCQVLHVRLLFLFAPYAGLHVERHPCTGG